MARDARKKEYVTVRLTRNRMVDGRDKVAGDWVRIPVLQADRWRERGIVDDGVPWEQPQEDGKHVLMVSHHACTRVCKQAAALKDRGYRVDSLSVSIPTIRDGFEDIKIAPETEFHEHIASSGAALIHVHNEPDRLMYAADVGANGRPIVYDCHDLGWYRTFKVSTDEMFAFKRADGIVHVSMEHREQAWKLHKWDAMEAITLSAPLRAWIPPENVNRKGVVYEGGSTPRATNANRFRDHTVVEAKFIEHGVPFHLYVPAKALTAYKGARPMVPYTSLPSILSRYSWGFIGTDIKTDKGDTCLPNKLFEYLLSGTPVFACNVPAVDRFMGKKAGIYRRDMDEMIGRMKRADWYGIQAEAVAARRFMDDEIDNTIDLYDALMGKYTCEWCGKKFKTAVGRAGHVKGVHPDEWKASRDAG